MKNIAEHCLGHYNTNNRVAAVGFFLAAHKVLRQHKVRWNVCILNSMHLLVLLLNRIIFGVMWRARYMILQIEINQISNF